MNKGIVTGDWHLDLVIKGLSRTNDIKKNALEIVKACDDEYDFFIHLGDMYSPSMKNPYILSETLSILSHLPEDVIKIVIAGNHDVLTMRDVEYPVTTISPLKWYGKNLHVVEDVTVLQFKGTTFICMPYMLSSYTRKKYGLDAQEYLDNRAEEILTSLKAKTAYVLSHLNIHGAVVGQEEDVPRGGDLFLPEIFTRSNTIRYVLNGHYHKTQLIDEKIYIPGSPERMDFGEEKDDKGYLIVEFDN